MELVRVKVRNKIKYIQIQDKTIDNFINTVATEFPEFIQQTNFYNVTITDNLGAPILNSQMFETVLTKYVHCASFFFNLEFKCNEPITAPIFISTNELKAFLIDHGGARVLNEFECNNTLSTRARSLLYNLLADLLFEKFGMYPTKEQKIMVSKAVIALFPILRTPNSKIEGIDLLFNTIDGNGVLIDRLKKRRRAVKQQIQRENEQDEPEALNETQSSPEEDYEFLKTTAVSDEILAEFRAKLLNTIVYRTNLLYDKMIDLKIQFPFFWAQPKLILDDFDGRYPGAGSLVTWYTQTCQKIVQKRLVEKPSFKTVWSDEIENVLLLLLFLPCSSPKTVFSVAVQKLIVFCRVSTPPMNAIQDGNDSPYIIAQGNTEKDVQKFYIVAEKHLLEVPSDFSFIQAFDMLFKVHKVFNMNFDPTVKKVMTFLQIFVYNIQEKGVKRTPAMINFESDLLETS